ncbi:nucleoside hydrolase [Sulfolobus sp. E11-6]|uniref:nucleoside hydrolase n=1 Tax=Sulfolobus sp. E11-6 TaxID=2663020 RepID=UPI001295D6AC|nr:nucleoside hydrolase [Sulfolobus sp. E11-6]QGA68099.1 nucleoside hydrolase [Sulfolobus sp. E11-6]
MRHFIIDCDTAEDDIMSLIMLLKHNINVLGITIVEGNVDFDQQVNTMLWALEFLDVNIPVFPGSRRPLVKSFRTVEQVHGKSGIGDEIVRPKQLRPENKHAVDAIIDFCERYFGEVEFLAISPLTNLALAYLKYPRLTECVKHVYIMGGTIYGRGNITPMAEYNFWVDPEATKIILHADFNKTIVPWEVAVANAIDSSTWEYIKSLSTKLSNFYIKIYSHYRKFSMERQRMRGNPHPDVITTAIAINPEIIKKSYNEYVDIETNEGLTRGALIIDYVEPGHILGSGKPNATIVYEIHYDKFVKMLLHSLS